MSFSFKNIISFAIISTIAFSHPREDDNDEIIKLLQKNVEMELRNSDRFLQNSNQENAPTNLLPIRVTFDDPILQQGSMPESQRQYLLQLMNTIVNFLSKFIKVVPTPSNNIFSNQDGKCLGERVPSDHIQHGKENSDLHLYIFSYKNEDKNYTASAGWCSFSYINSRPRPNFGLIKFNLNFFQPSKINVYQFHKDFQIVLHEIIHVLGFTSESYKYWIDKSTGNSYGVENLKKITEIYQNSETLEFILKSPEVQATARKYYGCNSLSGMLLQNEGPPLTILSHWKLSIIRNELMAPSPVLESSSLSVFTVALLKDTGFLGDVNENLSESIYWGKGKGCDFVMKSQNKTDLYEEFSVKNGCSFYNDGPGFYYQEPLSSQTKMSVPYSDHLCHNPKLQAEKNNLKISLEEFRHDSSCFVSNLKHPDFQKENVNYNVRCHKFKCSADHKKITISSSELPGFELECGENQQNQVKIATFKSLNLGSVTCPSDYKKFCDNKKCKNYCSMNGFCLRGVCHCNPGYIGNDCATKSENGMVLFNGIQVPRCSGKYFANPDNTCQISCPAGYYKKQDKNECQQCDFSCSECTGPFSTDCKACQFLTYLDGKSYVAVCPSGKYPNENTKQCDKKQVVH